MESAEETLREIASVSQRIIDALAATARLSRERSEPDEISRIQLSGDLHKVLATSLAIVDTLESSSDYRDDNFDERLNDWLTGQEPATCLDTLNTMAKLTRADTESHKGTSWKWFAMFPLVSNKDRVKEVTTLFAERKGHFHFLLTTDVWNRDKQVQRRSGASTQADSLDSPMSETLSLLGADVNILEDVPMSIDAVAREVVEESNEKKEVDWKQREDLLQWLDGLDCTEKHNSTLDLRQSDTCTWLPNTSAYKAWRHGEDPFLWLHGKPGAGKSVLAASVIDKLESSLEDGEFLAFFYCDFRSRRTTNAAEVMRSLLSQLMHKFLDGPIDSGDTLHDLIKEKRRGESVLSNAKRLARLVSTAANRLTRRPLIVIDALDECRDIGNLLDALVSLSQAKLRLFVTSRPLQLIKDRFLELPSLSLERMSAAVLADIQLHVRREIDSSRRLRIAPAGLKEQIHSTLCENADGMFRWIQCQLDTLKRCMTPIDIRDVLSSLPRGLEETYRRILLAIDKEKREAEVARRTLTWLVATFVPLRLSQIVEALSIDLNRRILDPDLAPMHESALLDVLSSLVTHDEETDIVILSHFSVQEYLTGELGPANLLAYHINLRHAEGQLARFCMCYLAACLNQARGSNAKGSLSHTTRGGKVDPDYEDQSRIVAHRVTLGSPSPESRPLLNYALSHTFGHLAFVDSRNRVVLKALTALGMDVRRNPSEWERMREERISAFDWPTPEDDFVLYILIAFAPVELLRSYLGRRPVKPKAGTNPLVYAAQLEKVEHAQALLSRGANLNSSGLWRSRQITPIEAAVHRMSNAVADLFLTKECCIPRRLFANLAQNNQQKVAAGVRMMARLLQTDDFAEWAAEVQDRSLLLSFLGPLDNSWTRVEVEERPRDEDATTVVRRLVQVGCELFAHGPTREKLHRRAAIMGHISTLNYMLSLDIPPPTDTLLDVSRSPIPSTTTMRFLLDNGADANAVTIMEDNALHIVTDANLPEEECLERVKLLVDAGCDASAYNLWSYTPLHCATRRGFTSVVQYLLSLGIPLPPDTLLLKKHTMKKTSTIIRHLIRMGFDVHVAAANADTILHVILDNSPARGQSTREDAISHHQSSEEDCLESTKILVEAGCNPSITNLAGETPMDVALRDAHVGVVEYFITLNVPLPPDALLKSARSQSPNALQMIKFVLEKGADARVVSARGDNALHIALSKAHLYGEPVEQIVKTLVEAGCDPSAHNIDGQTPFYLAAKYEDKATISYLCSRGVPLPRDLMLVTTRAPIYTLLVELGADLLAVAKSGDTVLHRVMETVYPENNALKLTKLLTHAGCSPFVLNSAGETPLQIAVRRGHISVIEHLLSLHAPLPFDALLTAFHPRSPPRNYRLQTIRFLIEKGVPTNVVTKNGDGVLHLALSSYWINEDDSFMAAKILIDAGCELGAQNVVGETTLHAAAKGGHIKTIEYLISQGVPFNPNILLAQATTTLSATKPAVMGYLISKGADIHATTSNGNTALHLTLACSHEHTRLETARILVESGCDPSRPDSSGETPLHVAARSGFPSLVKYLRSRNAPLPSDILLAAVSMLGRAHLRAQTPHVLPMFRLLIREGANVHVIAPNGNTLLHTVIQKGPDTLLNAVQFCDPQPRKANFSPWELIEILLRAGCDPFVRNVDGLTSLDLAEEQGHSFYGNFVRLVTVHDGPDVDRHALQKLRRKRRAEETVEDVAGRLAKRGRPVDDIVRDEDEIAEVDEQLMV